MIDAVIDLSHWQPDPIDWAAVKSAGIAVVMLKATQGSNWVDPCFLARTREAHCAELLVGAYHFCDASSPSAQAENLLRVAGRKGVLAIDVEPNDMPGDTVSVQQAAEIASYLQIATRRAPVVYIGRYGPSGTGLWLPNAILSRCPLWLPDWSNHPRLPLGWAHWTFWQYTDVGSVSGIDAPVDRSHFFGTLEELGVWWNKG